MKTTMIPAAVDVTDRDDELFRALHDVARTEDDVAREAGDWVLTLLRPVVAVWAWLTGGAR